MNCRNHPNVGATASCAECGKNICNDCTHMLAKEPLCLDCYRRECYGYLEETKKASSKNKRSLVALIIFYIIGIILIIMGLTSGEDAGVLALYGALCCGLPVGISGWKVAGKAHRDYESKHGASYTITDSGVYKDQGLGGKILMFVLGVCFGVIYTPIKIIKKIKAIGEYKEEIQSVSEVANEISTMKF